MIPLDMKAIAAQQRESALRRWLATLDTYANETYGRPISSAIVAGNCVTCGKAARSFTTEEALATYPALGLCERCQNARHLVRGTVVPFDRTETA